MSVYRAAYVYCDVCDEELDDSRPTIGEIRAAARALGWHRLGPSADICRECWAESLRPPQKRQGR